MDLVVDCLAGTIGPNPASPDMPMHEIYAPSDGFVPPRCGALRRLRHSYPCFPLPIGR